MKGVIIISNNNEKLTPKEKTLVAVESLLQFVPVVGPPLATAYFSHKQEKRLKRLESFYEEFGAKLNNHNIPLCDYSEHDEEELINLIEKINIQIETESSKEKIDLFQNYFITLLKSPTTKENYDARFLMLNTLSSISFLEFQVLLSYYNKSKVTAPAPYIEGANSHLESLGLLRSTYYAETTVGTNPVNRAISISDYGEMFIKFIELYE